ncbi:MAG TPA: hypothetical protein VH044_11000, partial [Polyangiaceae bacterium]|nr:hypothetical protein [Polyangiaceae bacterium]
MHTVSRALEGALSASRLRSLSLPFLAVAAVGWSVGSVACSATPASLPLGQDTSDDSGGGSGSTSGSGSGSGSSSGSSSGSGVFQGADSGGMGTGTCQTGMYTGTFSCTFVYDPNADAAPAAGSLDAGSNPFPITITGSLSFLLTQSTSGELGQDMASGTFDLTAGITTGMATLGGTLECGS